MEVGRRMTSWHAAKVLHVAFHPVIFAIRSKDKILSQTTELWDLLNTHTNKDRWLMVDVSSMGNEAKSQFMSKLCKNYGKRSISLYFHY